MKTGEAATTSHVHPREEIGPGLTWVLAIATGLSVANLYYNQPLLANMGRDFNVSARAVGLIPTLGQVGYALGLLLLVPLGDIIQRRRIITVLLVLVAVSLGLEATARNLPWLAFASLAIGATTVVPQVILPLTAQLSPPDRRGKAVGLVFGGLLIGILLSRTLSGFLADRMQLGWRNVYWIAAGLMILLGIALAFTLPDHPLVPGMTYGKLLRSVWDLARTEPVLQQAALNGSLMFACFSAFWATLAFRLEAPPFHYGAQVAGLFGIVGAAGAAAAPLVGRFADRVSPRSIVGLATTLMLLSYLEFWLLGESLIGLVVGVVLMDLAAQAAQVSNLTRVYSLSTSAHSRLNTAFMVTYFVGGAIGSLLGTALWSSYRWTGVCLLGLALSALALLLHIARLPATPSRPAEPSSGNP